VFASVLFFYCGKLIEVFAVGLIGRTMSVFLDAFAQASARAG